MGLLRVADSEGFDLLSLRSQLEKLLGKTLLRAYYILCKPHLGFNSPSWGRVLAPFIGVAALFSTVAKVSTNNRVPVLRGRALGDPWNVRIHDAASLLQSVVEA